MIRRARIALISAIVLFSCLGLVLGTVFLLARTAFGRSYIHRFVVSLVRSRLHGSVYIGEIRGGLLNDLTIDSVALRDPDDSLFLSTGRVTLHYDVRDFLDRRILLRGVRAEHPLMYIRQHEDGTWNFRTIFSSGGKSAPSHGHGFGDYVIIDSAVVRNATFLLTLPWHLSPHLHGYARDSALKFELKRTDHEIRRTREGLARTWRWTGGNVTLVHGRVSHPDSAERLFVVRDASVNEADPPFLFKNASATIRQRGDSVWIDVPHWDLPKSTGNGRAKIWWGGKDLPVRYAIHAIGDSVSMSDVDWIYPTLPHTGSGRTVIDIFTEPKNLRRTDYVLTKLDARSTRSHLTGRMTFTLGEDTLIVKDVQLAASPVNFDLLRTLNGKPFPYNWQGDITGTVRASGGNLGRFKVEESHFVFADANVPGAISRGSAQGELNIFNPALTAFHGFTVNAETFDLRTPQFLNKEFPRLHGTVSGSAVLDSSWLDVRFHNGDVLHHDGGGLPSHVTGSGRVTWGEKYLTYDLNVQAQPVSFTTLRQSYPTVPLHGQFTGPIRVQGQSPNLHVETSLVGDAGEGTLVYSGQVDADPPVYGARGTGSFTNADLRLLLDRPELAKTVVNGSYAVDLAGDTLPHLTGLAAVSLAPSTLGAVRVDSSTARVRFDSGLVYVDTLALHTSAGYADAHGTVAMIDGRPGSLLYTASLTSLASANELFGHPVTTPIAGAMTFAGTLTGTPSSLALAGTVNGHNVAYGSAQMQHVSGAMSLADLTHTPRGTVSLLADSLLVGSFPLDRLRAALRVSDAHTADFDAQFAGQGSHGATTGHVNMQAGRTEIQVDTANLITDSLSRYRLSAPFRILADTHSVAIDSLLFTRGSGGLVALRNMRLSGDSIQGSLRTSGFSLALLELLTKKATHLTGALTANVDVHGTTAHPQVSGAVTVKDGFAYLPGTGTRLEHIAADIGLDGDTVRVKTLTAQTNQERHGLVNVSGTVALDHYDNPVFALKATANHLRAIDRRGLASLDVSTTTPLTLTGPYRGATVRGGIQVDEGTIYIPELLKKRVVDLNDSTLATVLDTTVPQNRTLLPQAPIDFTKNLRLENVGVHIGDDVWLRSAEANIKLGGALSVTLTNNARTGASQLALEGELSADRGVYHLDVVPLVQPVFDVEKGTLRFYGTPDLNPTLHITAINTVRQPQQSLNGQDVRIRVTIGGTLSAPTLVLSSADNLPLTQSDLLSYLVTGQPAFALDYSTQQYVNQHASAVIRSAGSVISSAIPRSVFDVVDLQTPSTLGGTVAQQGLDAQSLLNTRAVLGKQLNNNLFLNFTTGFCAENFRNNLGLRLEYHFNQAYTALFGLEPGSSDLACARNGVTPSIQQTPPQFGLDLSRAWRF